MHSHSPDTVSNSPSDEGVDFGKINWAHLRTRGVDHTLTNLSPADFARRKSRHGAVVEDVHEQLENSMPWKIPTDVHGAVVAELSDAIGNFNSQINHGSRNLPVLRTGSSNEPLDHDDTQQPDFSCRVTGRAFKTFVAEIAFTQSIREMIIHLRNYVTRTADVMMAVGIKIYEPRLDGTAAMAFISFERLTENNMIATRLISFGTAPLQALAQSTLETNCGIACTGVGCGGNPCDVDHQHEYHIAVPYNYLINTDNFGLQLLQPIAHPAPHCVISLLNIQLSIFGVFGMIPH